MAHNPIYFPTNFSNRTTLALRINSIVKYCVCVLQHETDVDIIADVVSDIARANDISINFIGFGSVTRDDINWIVEACDRMELWHTEGMRAATIAAWEKPE